MSGAERHRAGLRIGDAEREDASAALGEHYAVGRLTRAELDERTSAVWAARTGADLAPLFADLPPPHGRAAGPTGPGGHRATRTGRRPRFPWLAFVLVLIVATAVTDVPWILLAIALWLVMSRVRSWQGPRSCGRRATPGGGLSPRRV